MQGMNVSVSVCEEAGGGGEQDIVCDEHFASI